MLSPKLSWSCASNFHQPAQDTTLYLADVTEDTTHFSNVIGILKGTLWSWWVYFHFCHILSLEASLTRMAFLPYPLHTSITSPRVSVLSHMWLIFLFWWSSYFEEVTIKQVNNSSASTDFLQSSFYCDFKEDNTQNGSNVAGRSVNKWGWRTEGNSCKLNFLWW